MSDPADGRLGGLIPTAYSHEACTRPVGAPPAAACPTWLDYRMARSAWVRGQRPQASASDLRAAELALTWIADNVGADERCAVFVGELERSGGSLGQERARLRRRTGDADRAEWSGRKRSPVTAGTIGRRRCGVVARVSVRRVARPRERRCGRSRRSASRGSPSDLPDGDGEPSSSPCHADTRIGRGSVDAAVAR